MPAILIDRPHNRSINWFPRAQDWREVLGYVNTYDCWKDKSGVVI
jgi:5'(3')-deoxyribonucleotidase